MNGAGRGLPQPGDPHHFNRTRDGVFRKTDIVVVTPFGITAFDTETATRGQLRDLPGVG